MPGLIRLLVLLGVLAGLALVPAFGAPFDSDGARQVRVTIVPDAPGGLAADGRLRIEGGRQGTRAMRLQFQLPLAGDQRWVLWLARDPLDAVSASGRGWAPPPTGFFRASVAGQGLDDVFPAGFGFPLPRGASGPQVVRLELRGSIRSAPTPQVLSEQDVLRYVGRETALAYAVYAALATLLIATLALYSAIRDPLFLLYGVYVVAAAGFMAATNGHLFAIPGLGAWGARGFWFWMLGFNAIALTMLLRFADVRSSASALLRGMDRWVMAAWALLLLPLVPAQAFAASLQAVATGAWMVGMPVAIWATVDGARRGIPMALATAAALLALLLSASAHEAMHRGWVADGILARHGYQFALVLMSAILFVGLSSRLALVRRRLDDETLARRNSEDRLRFERLRAGLAQTLQDELRAVPADEIAPHAFRQLCRHACEMLGIEDAVVLGHGYLGNELVLAQASDRKVSALAQAALVARSILRLHAQNREAVHVRIDGERVSEDPRAPRYAIVPMRLHAPAWAALVLRAQAEQGLADADLQALAELARIAVTHAEEAYASIQLRKTAEYDALTGSLNRRSLDQALAREFKSSVGQAPLSVLFIDIDWFKRINDEHGHACGDHCLYSVATTLRAELRPSDALGRYGGEEFLVLLPGHDAAASRVIAERLRQAIERTAIDWQGLQLWLTISIGMAARRDNDPDASALLERADKALYAAKREGRNRVCVAPPAFT
ncbi:MAG: diguanylate cyclase [Lysobacteraceae bacterium]|nr:MAG: diguanylate cyclase [Xanthomonadaceae bacterium]